MIELGENSRFRRPHSHLTPRTPTNISISLISYIARNHSPLDGYISADDSGAYVRCAHLRLF